MKPSELDSFTLGYVLAALWTSDEAPPQGDYRETGLSLVRRIHDYWMQDAIADCARFQSENEALLEQAGDAERNGHDFWLTRNRHGVGFWARDYDEAVGDALTKASRAYGEAYLDFESDLEEEIE